VRDMTAAQRLQCRQFLAELRRTGNVKLSADRVGIATQTWQRRRRAHPAFGTEWAAALSFARDAGAVGTAAAHERWPEDDRRRIHGAER